MKRYVYPIIIYPKQKNEKYQVVYIPDFKINTEGKDLGDAIFMARDAIGLVGLTILDDGRRLPRVKTLKPDCKDDEIVTLVDIDFKEYRKNMSLFQQIRQGLNEAIAYERGEFKNVRVTTLSTDDEK